MAARPTLPHVVSTSRMVLAFLFLGVGLLLLVKGADWLVDGASSLAARLGVAPIVIGLTIVAFGTSMPELVVNLFASWSGNTDIAIGNVVGSNIVNILLILGIAGCICPLAVKSNTVWKEVPMALLAMVLVWVMANDVLVAGNGPDRLDRIDGLVLIAFFIIFLYYTFGISKVDAGTAEEVAKHSVPRSWVLSLGGIAALAVGGKFAVEGAVIIAESLGVSERVIGLTIVAIGTSLPELLTSAMAAYRKNADIAVGNVVGSNIFNVFWILGVSSTIRPLPFTAANGSDVVVGVGATFLLFVAMFVGKRHLLERWQSVAFILLYVAYLTSLVLWQ